MVVEKIAFEKFSKKTKVSKLIKAGFNLNYIKFNANPK
jgi:hypothetical protein